MAMMSHRTRPIDRPFPVGLNGPSVIAFIRPSYPPAKSPWFGKHVGTHSLCVPSG